MSKKWFFALTVLLAVMIGLAGRSMVDLNTAQREENHQTKMVNSLLAERTNLRQDVADLEAEVVQIETELTNSEAATKVAKGKVIGLKKKIARIERREQIAPLRAVFAQTGREPEWKMWDDDFSHFLKWFVQGQPSTWGNLGDCVFPVLYEKAKQGAPGACERYILLKDYVETSKPLLSWKDTTSFNALEEIEQILY